MNGFSFYMQTSFWHKYPLLRPFIAFIAALITAINLEEFQWAGFIFIVGIIVILVLLLHFFKINYHFRWVTGFLLIILFILLGFLVVQEERDINNPLYYGRYISGQTTIVGKIIDPPVEKTRSVKAEIEVLHVISEDDKIYNTSGHALIYFTKDSSSLHLRYGDIIQTAAKLQPIEPPKNPEEFNYRKYLSFHNIHYQGFAIPERWYLLDRNRGNWFFSKVYKVRRYFLNELKEHIDDPKSMAVAAALLIGFRDLLDREIIQAYSGSGAMHVLAVSGLHVGIIYIILNYAFSFIKKRKKGNYIKPLLILTGIWFYALITGLSPSVLRAATMFTFITAGPLFNRSSNIYGNILASAFLLLLINPFLITEVGFLLSYSAVIGIVYLQPKIYRSIYFRNWLADKIWALTAVSLAAQIATFPIGLLYFHQFPTYFLLSNLIVIPAAVVILYVGVALFIFSAIPVVDNIIGMTLEFIIQLLNISIALINELPNALISGIHITLFETYLIYGIIILLTASVVLKNKRVLLSTTVVALILISSFSYRNIQNYETQELIVYHTQNATAVNIVDNKRSFLLADNSLLDDPEKLRFHILHYWWKLGINEANKAALPSSTTKFKYKGKTIVVLRDQNIPPNADYIIISGSPRINITQLQKLSPEVVIFDASNKDYQVKQWIEECEDLGLNCYNVRTQGAFVQQFN